MIRLKAVIDFIFSSYKRTAIAMVVLALALSLPITTTVLAQKSAQKKVLGINTKDGPLLAVADGPNLYMGQVQLRKNAGSTAFPNGNCS
jgi:hypothetical protein